MSLISRRVISAAAKLALVYSVLVTLEFAVLILVLRIGLPPLNVLLAMAGWLAIPFAGAFVLLAVARRWGFIALWVIPLAFSAWMAVTSQSYTFTIGFIFDFILWTIFALPLWIIGQAGIPLRSSNRLRVGPVRFSASTALLACWIGLLVGARSLLPPVGTDVVMIGTSVAANLFGWTCAIAPFILTTYAIRHVWVGTAHPAVIAYEETPALG